MENELNRFNSFLHKLKSEKIDIKFLVSGNKMVTMCGTIRKFNYNFLSKISCQYTLFFNTKSFQDSISFVLDMNIYVIKYYEKFMEIICPDITHGDKFKIIYIDEVV